MKKWIGGFVALAMLTLGSFVFLSAPANAATTCTHSISWYKQDPSRIGGPDLSPGLEAGILAKTGKSSLAQVLSSSGWSVDLLAAKAIIVTASNGAPGETGFTGTLGKAFYGVADYFQGRNSLSWFQLGLSTLVLEAYNYGFLGLPACK